ncbi:hypothetical protein CYLTODRAFT_148054 [Cylindrobasidium torrendii FP15055 ss-10]|uniref:Uncharacterized protein n=1 Tax=Cylindrobasidium torrendii FP15055 ss-10 TaxID=1314674 RepID=A0A0D7BKG7_9AGAR|nr:hypothetical protein CYLTODRAFT_148054 [Cylindrobasidium torrendii FP15055 ss-10]
MMRHSPGGHVAPRPADKSKSSNVTPRGQTLLYSSKTVLDAHIAILYDERGRPSGFPLIIRPSGDVFWTVTHRGLLQSSSKFLEQIAFSQTTSSNDRDSKQISASHHAVDEKNRAAHRVLFVSFDHLRTICPPQCIHLHRRARWIPLFISACHPTTAMAIVRMRGRGRRSYPFLQPTHLLLDPTR